MKVEMVSKIPSKIEMESYWNTNVIGKYVGYGDPFYGFNTIESCHIKIEELIDQYDSCCGELNDLQNEYVNLEEAHEQLQTDYDKLYDVVYNFSKNIKLLL